MKRFRGGLVFKAYRRLDHSTLGSRGTKTKKMRPSSEGFLEWRKLTTFPGARRFLSSPRRRIKSPFSRPRSRRRTWMMAAATSMSRQLMDLMSGSKNTTACAAPHNHSTHHLGTETTEPSQSQWLAATLPARSRLHTTTPSSTPHAAKLRISTTACVPELAPPPIFSPGVPPTRHLCRGLSDARESKTNTGEGG